MVFIFSFSNSMYKCGGVHSSLRDNTMPLCPLANNGNMVASDNQGYQLLQPQCHLPFLVLLHLRHGLRLYPREFRRWTNLLQVPIFLHYFTIGKYHCNRCVGMEGRRNDPEHMVLQTNNLYKLPKLRSRYQFYDTLL